MAQQTQNKPTFLHILRPLLEFRLKEFENQQDPLVPLAKEAMGHIGNALSPLNFPHVEKAIDSFFTATGVTPLYEEYILHAITHADEVTRNVISVSLQGIQRLARYTPNDASFEKEDVITAINTLQILANTSNSEVSGRGDLAESWIFAVYIARNTYSLINSKEPKSKYDHAMCKLCRELDDFLSTNGKNKEDREKLSGTIAEVKKVEPRFPSADLSGVPEQGQPQRKQPRK